MKNIKKGFAVLLIFSVIFAFTGCSGKSSAEKTVKTVLDAIIIGDTATVEKYSDIKAMPEDNDFIDKDINSLVLSKMSYEILSTEKNEDGSYAVRASVTVADISPVMERLMGVILGYAFNAAFPEDEDNDSDKIKKEFHDKVYSIFEEELNKENLKTETKEITLKAVKEDGSWKISDDGQIISILTAVMDKLDNMF